MPEIVVNGEVQKVSSNSVEELIRELDLVGKKFAIEMNQSVIPRTNFSTTVIQDGDKLEVVHFVGGG